MSYCIPPLDKDVIYPRAMRPPLSLWCREPSNWNFGMANICIATFITGCLFLQARKWYMKAPNRTGSWYTRAASRFTLRKKPGRCTPFVGTHYELSRPAIHIGDPKNLETTISYIVTPIRAESIGFKALKRFGAQTMSFIH